MIASGIKSGRACFKYCKSIKRRQWNVGEALWVSMIDCSITSGMDCFNNYIATNRGQ